MVRIKGDSLFYLCKMMASAQKIIGLTGGIGSGKSTVAQVLSNMGYPIFDADSEVKRLYHTAVNLQKEVSKTFGEDLFLEGQLNNALLAQRLFNQPDGRTKIKQIIKPFMNERFNEWQMEHKNASLLFKEAAILVESGDLDRYAYIIQITAPVEMRIKRVMKRSGLTEQEIKLRMQAQLHDDERKKYCQYSIINDNARAILPQIQSILASIVV
jgi:dephospho-CoA kinase